MKVAVGHGIFVEGHTQSFGSFSLFIFQNFPWCSCYEVILTIEMMYGGGDSCQSLQEGDFFMMHEICTMSLEGVMRKNVDSDIDVSGHNSRILITLSVEDVIMGIGHTLLNGHLQFLLSFNHSLSFTAFTSVLFRNYHSHSLACLTWSLDLSVHTRAYLCHFEDDTDPLARTTRLGIGASLSFTVSAYSHTCYSHLFHLATKYLLQSDIDLDQLRLGFLGTLILLVYEVEYVAS